MNSFHKIIKTVLAYATLCAIICLLGTAVSCKSNKSAQNFVPAKQHMSRTSYRAVPQGYADSTATDIEKRLVDEARSWLGVPYRYGGTTRDGADCSGFLCAVYDNAAGIQLPRNTRSQREHCSGIEPDSLRLGDILFFTSKASEGKVAHVGLYSGNGHMIHASSSRGVVEDDLSLNYYVTHFTGAGRVPALMATNKPSKAVCATDMPTYADSSAVNIEKQQAADSKNASLPPVSATDVTIKTPKIESKPDTFEISPDDEVRRAFAGSKKL